MSRRIFISFNYTDKGLRNDLSKMFQPFGGPIKGKPDWVKIDVSTSGADAIKKEIRRIMRGCKIALFLIGLDVHNSPYINYEMAYAKSPLGIPCYGIQHPLGLFGVPNINLNLKVIPWNPRTIASILNEL